MTRLLRHTLHYTGVTLSDDLDTPAVSRRMPPVQAAVQAVRVGIDMVYIAGVGGSGADAIGRQAYAALLRAAEDGTLPLPTLQDSYARIAAFKGFLARAELGNAFAACAQTEQRTVELP